MRATIDSGSAITPSSPTLNRSSACCCCSVAGAFRSPESVCCGPKRPEAAPLATAEPSERIYASTVSQPPGGVGWKRPANHAGGADDA